MVEANSQSEDGIGKSSPIRLAAKLDLKASTELVETLRARRGADLTLDGSEVSHLGAHAVQTLLVAAHTWSRDGHALVCANLTDQALEQLGVLGIDPMQLSGGATP